MTVHRLAQNRTNSAAEFLTSLNLPDEVFIQCSGAVSYMVPDMQSHDCFLILSVKPIPYLYKIC